MRKRIQQKWWREFEGRKAHLEGIIYVGSGKKCRERKKENAASKTLGNVHVCSSWIPFGNEYNIVQDIQMMTLLRVLDQRAGDQDVTHKVELDAEI